MRKYLHFLIAVALISCNGPSKFGYQIVGKVDDDKLNGKYVYIYPYGLKSVLP